MSGFTDQQVPDQTGKVVLITGGNAGIGFETAQVLADKNARVIIGCRSEEKARQAIAKIREKVLNADVEFLPLDLSDLTSVEKAAGLLQKEPKLDVLINNAGIMMPPLEFTKQGIESQLGVNHVGPFLLTLKLLPLLEKSKQGRVVNTSSMAARFGEMYFDDLNADKGYNATDRYGQSKLANLLFSEELAQRLKEKGSNTISVCCHPGIADTELSRHMPVWFQWITPLVRLMFNTPLQGAWPTLMAATSSEVRNGDTCGPAKRRQTAGPAKLGRIEKSSLCKEDQQRLWQDTVALSGVDF